MDRETLSRILDYDPGTGRFVWKINASTKAQVGKDAGTLDSYGYTIIRFQGKGYKAHRLAWILTYGEEPDGLIDHINRVRSDNRISNLRVVDAHQNAQNLGIHKKNRSGYRWVSWFSQYGQWKARFNYRSKSVFVGYFDDPHEAYMAAVDARKRIGAPIALEVLQ